MRRVLLGGFALIALSGCADLGAVQAISSRLTDASSSWNAVGADFERSCERERQFNPALADCADQARATDAINAIDALLTAYFKALADASNGQNFTVQNGLSDLAKSVAAVPGIDAGQVQAASGLAGLLLDRWTEAARERVLARLIHQGAPEARELIGALRQIVPPALNSSLGAERDRTSFQFALYIAQGGGRVDRDPAVMCRAGPLANRFSGPNFLLALEYCRRIAIVDDRIKALVEYQASLATADKALAELDSSKSKLKGKALAEHLYAIGKALSDDIKAVNKAF